MDKVRTPTDLQAFMDAHQIPGEILILDTPTPTVEAAALAVGARTEQIVKSVLFTLPNHASLPEHAVLTISCGDQLVERRVLAARYGVGRKRVRLASPDVVLELTGYAVGSVPPFGHHRQLAALLDPRVLTLDEIYAGGGSNHALVRLNPEALIAITQADVVDLHTRPA